MPDDGVTVTRDDPDASYGTYLDCHGDIDGDGYADLAISSQDDQTERQLQGRTVILHGPLAGSLRAEDADIIFDGSVGTGTNVGYVVRVADVTADGVADLLYSLGDTYGPWSDAVPIDTDLLVVAPGPIPDGPSTAPLAGQFWVEGEGHGELDVADVDGDGMADLVRPELEPDAVGKHCGAIYSGADLALAGEGDRLTSADDAMAVLGCDDFVSDTHRADKAWVARANEDLDGDGYLDVFITTTVGSVAWQGGAGRWSGTIEDDFKLHEDYVPCAGVRDAAFTHDDEGELLWALSLECGPSYDTWTSYFTGRVPVFQGWEWASLSYFDDAWTWVAAEPDNQGIDPMWRAAIPVRFSHEDGTRLWWGQPSWASDRTDSTYDDYGRLTVYDLATFQATPLPE